MTQLADIPPEILAEFATLLDQYDDAASGSKLQRVYATTYEDECKRLGRARCEEIVKSGTLLGPYEWAMRFHDAGATCSSRAVLAGNQVGKTFTIGAEVGMHLLGWYPKGWKGKKWDRPINMVCAGPTNELTRDVLQAELLGEIEPGSRVPCGRDSWIPADKLVEVKYRQGVADALSHAIIRHSSGGYSRVAFKSYVMGADAFQAVKLDLFWADEEPRTGESDGILGEILMRLAARQGHFLLSRTPLFGRTSIIKHFRKNKPHIFHVKVGWDDAPHLTDEKKEELKEGVPEHHLKTRMHGDDMMGSGGVYTLDQSIYTCSPIPLLSHWKHIAAVDFGIGHPFACVWLAYDADQDRLYLYDSFKVKDETPDLHALKINRRGGKDIPVSWPHDGMNRDKGTGVQLEKAYRDAGVNMLFLSARFDDEVGGPQSRETATMQLLDWMRSGKLLIFDTQTELLAELRGLYRKDGFIVDEDDDLESALRYGFMMRRYAAWREKFAGKTREPATYGGDGYDPHQDFRAA